MTNNFFKLSVGNIKQNPTFKSDIISQILYGEKFKILSKKKGWFKIKTNFDNYIGYIKEVGFNNNFEPVRKIFKLQSKIYKKINNNYFLTNNFLYFGSGISIKSQNKNYIEFEKNKWIKKKIQKK